MKRILLIDNYDSFVYNIPQVIGRYNNIETDVVRNDAVNDSHYDINKYSHIIISPGPGNPTIEQDFGSCQRIIEFYAGKRPILGICLGHQGIAHHYGGTVIPAQRILHGETSNIKIIEDSPLWKGISSLKVMRYHSLAVDLISISKSLTPIAVTDDEHEELMAYQCIARNIYAVQFHPESIETPCGEKMLNNFINI